MYTEEGRENIYYDPIALPEQNSGKERRMRNALFCFKGGTKWLQRRQSAIPLSISRRALVGLNRCRSKLAKSVVLGHSILSYDGFFISRQPSARYCFFSSLAKQRRKWAMPVLKLVFIDRGFSLVILDPMKATRDVFLYFLFANATTWNGETVSEFRKLWMFKSRARRGFSRGKKKTHAKKHLHPHLARDLKRT